MIENMQIWEVRKIVNDYKKKIDSLDKKILNLDIQKKAFIDFSNSLEEIIHKKVINEKRKDYKIAMKINGLTPEEKLTPYFLDFYNHFIEDEGVFLYLCSTDILYEDVPFSDYIEYEFTKIVKQKFYEANNENDLNSKISTARDYIYTFIDNYAEYLQDMKKDEYYNNVDDN